MSKTIDGEIPFAVDFGDETVEIKVEYTAYPAVPDYVCNDRYYCEPGSDADADFEVTGKTRPLSPEEWLECTAEGGKYFPHILRACLQDAFPGDDFAYILDLYRPDEPKRAEVVAVPVEVMLEVPELVEAELVG